MDLDNREMNRNTPGQYLINYNLQNLNTILNQITKSTKSK